LYVGTIHRTFKAMYCTIFWWKGICLSIVRWFNRTFKSMYCTVHWWKRICIWFVHWYNI
jgi:hypothetical protein